jgi:predicted dehydrogenase
VVPNIDAMLGARPDVVVLASPPRYHAEQAVAVLAGNCDVFCEKPLATDLASGERIAAAASSSGHRVFVGLVRRQFPAAKAIRHLVQSGAIGDIQSIECFEGGPFTWPVRSADYFRPAGGNGGVLQDIGTHCLDLLVWWLGAPTSLSYSDDAMGGVEANCSIDLDFGSARAHVRLSRDWARPNCYVILGTGGRIDWAVEDASRVEITLDDGVVGELSLAPAAAHPRSNEEGSARGRTWFGFEDAFAAQLRAVADRRTDVLVEAVDALPVLALVDHCYATRTAIPMPWMVPDAMM